MRNLKNFILQSWLLIVAAFVCGLLLAMTNSALDPIIKKNEMGEMYDKMKKLIPQAETFEVVIPKAEIAGNETDVYQALDANKKSLGFSFVGTGSGFQDKIKLVIAVNNDANKLLGFDVLFSNETPGFGSRMTEDWFMKQFVGAPTGQLTLVKTGNTEEKNEQIVAITGATVTSTAVVNIFNNHIAKLKELLKEKGLIK
ncbi:MAG: FMN-binding protein [Phycisphaerae bacterium]|jgi:electron transport complex protein RnfG